MRRILFITAFAPGNLTAGQSYSSHLIRDLACDYKIDLIIVEPSRYETGGLNVPDNVQILIRRQLSGFRRFFNSLLLFWLHPLFTGRFCLGIARYIRKISPAYDFVYCDFSQVFLFGLAAANAPKRLFFMAHDVILQRYQRRGQGILHRLNLAWCRKTEGWLLRKRNAEVFCFSAKDQDFIQRNYNREAREVRFYLDEKIEIIDFDRLALSKSFCFYAAWHRFENAQGLEWFLDNVLPLLSSKTEFQIIGKGFPSGLLARLLRTPAMQLLGFLPDPYPVIAGSPALIAPIFYGAGVKTKVVESLACGTPVIGTPIALEGIRCNREESLILCRTAQQFADAINSFSAPGAREKESLSQFFQTCYRGTMFRDILCQI
jgi:glycosyltransferase involved in cell wall biosynthesis